MKKKITILFFAVSLSAQLDSQVFSFGWSRTIGGVSDEQVRGTCTDAAGNVYNTGNFFMADFDPGPAVFNMTTNGLADIFIQKLDAAGNLVWAKSIGGSSFDAGQAITVDAAGNVYVTGFFLDVVDFNPGSATSTLATNGNEDIFVLKLDASGNFVWAKNLGGTSPDVGYGISVDGTGNVYTAGSFAGTGDFNPGSAVHTMTVNGGFANDIFYSKLSSSGNFVWAKQIGGSSSDIAFSMAGDAAGNVYSTGYFLNVCDFDPGNGVQDLFSSAGAVFVNKLDASGNYVWAKQIGGGQGGSFGNGITIDASGNTYVTGAFMGAADFDPGSASVLLTSAGEDDAFVCKLNGSGAFSWAVSMGGAGSDKGLGIAVDPSGNVYSTGSFSLSADFDPSSQVNNLTSAGGTDAYISALSASGTFLWSGANGGSGDDKGVGIDANATAVYASGTFSNACDLNPWPAVATETSVGAMDVFTTKIAVASTVFQSELAGSGPLKMFPNPCSGKLTISLEAIPAQCSIYSVSGQLLLAYTLISARNEVDLSTLAQGFYLIEVKDRSGEIQTRRLIKE